MNRPSWKNISKNSYCNKRAIVCERLQVVFTCKR